MRLEPINYQEPFVHEDEDDVSSTAAVGNETYDGSDEGKKRSATEDENPGATKKSKSDGEGEQKLPAVPALPNIVLSMRDDANYAQFMKEEFKKMDWVEYNPTIGKVMGNEILQKLQLEYHIVDKNGDSIDDNFALEKIRACLRNKYEYETRKTDQQSLPSKQLPNIVLSMQKDKKYEKIMTKFFYKMDGVEYADEMAEEILQALKQKYHLVDQVGVSIDDDTALQKLAQCLRNQYYRSRNSDQQPQPSNVTAPSALTAVTAESLAGSDIVLDMRINKRYRDITNKCFNDYVNKKYKDISETGEAILHELKRNLGTGGKLRKRTGNGFVEVESEAAARAVILQSLSRNYPTRKPHSTQGRTQDNTDQFQNQEERPMQTPTRDLPEGERLRLLDFFGRDIIVQFLRKQESFQWKFYSKQGLSEVWVAVKEGFTKKNAKEDETMLTGLRKIAHWAFREGYFEKYSKDKYGRKMLEKHGLSAESYSIIFDREGERSGVVSRRTVSPNSSPRENVNEEYNIAENRSITFQLEGEERLEYLILYDDIDKKLTSASEENGKEFYGTLLKCLDTRMKNTQQWNEKKGILAEFVQHFEKAAKINRPHIRDEVIPAIIKDAKEKLIGA